MKQPNITKSELAEMLGVSRGYLSQQLNIHYYDDLVAVGYKKTSKIITPKVYRTFIELYGYPLNSTEPCDF